MTISVTESNEAIHPLRGMLPLLVGALVYALLLACGNQLLNDPDTMWQVTVGQWILDHRAVPETDLYSFTMAGQPWMSTQWLAQAIYAKAYATLGWSGPVVVAAAAIGATFALLAKSLNRHLGDGATLLLVAVALALTAAHLLARAHVLAMPVMLLWIGGLIDAADRRAAPSLMLLPLIALWANLHGGFVFGLFFIAPAALDAVVNAEASSRKSLALRWAVFALAALAAACVTPYGWNALLAARKILSLGAALPLIMEWRPADFGKLGTFELVLLFGIALALTCGVRLPPTRILMLLGLLHMALAQGRAAEILALVAPLVLAAALAREIGRADRVDETAPPLRAALSACVGIALVVGTVAYAAPQRFAPNTRQSPVAAVVELKTLHVGRVFNDYDFGGYLIASGVPTFIDGRTELFGETFFLAHNAASTLAEPDTLFRLLDDEGIEATLLRTQSPAARLLDHVDGWQKVYSDDIATIHLRKLGAVHRREPAVDAATK